MNEEFLGEFDRSFRILEVGSNVGSQHQILQCMGFKNLYGIELQPYAVEVAKQHTQGINLIQGSAFDLPFQDGWFDLVFTSGVLIHISPEDIGRALDEIYRCAKTYIWGWEYFADEYTEIAYRGHKGLLWKTNFAQLWLDRFDGLQQIKTRNLPYRTGENMDQVYLLRK